jgi:hypothetical protein
MQAASLGRISLARPRVLFAVKACLPSIGARRTLTATG